MNELYFTSNLQKVYDIAKHKAETLNIPFYPIEGNKEGLNKLLTLHNSKISGVVFIIINKSPMFDILLPILEKSDLHIILVSDKFDIKQAIISRCQIKAIETNEKDIAIAYMERKIMPDEITIDFLIALTDYIILNHRKIKNVYDKLLIVNDIIHDIQLSTHNILQDDLKSRLKAIL